VDVGFKFNDVFLRENVGDNLALASVHVAIACIEDTPPNGHEGIIEVGLEGAVAVGVNNLQGIRVGYGDMIWSYANDFA
jgi:hypothetical protein